jgi:hypothetical protein
MMANKSFISSVAALLLFGCAASPAREAPAEFRPDASVMFPGARDRSAFVDIGQGPLKVAESTVISAVYRLYQGGQFSTGSAPLTDEQVIEDLHRCCQGGGCPFVGLLVSSEEVQVSDLIRAIETISRGCESKERRAACHLRIYIALPEGGLDGSWRIPSLAFERVRRD